MDNDPSIPEGINIVFANDGDIYERLYVNQDYTTPLSLISQFAASQFPSTFDLNRPSRQFYPDVFNLYTYEKEIRYTSRNTTPQGAVEIYNNILAYNYFTHEFGHSLYLFHDNSCIENIMSQGLGSNTYLKPVSQMGRMWRYSSISSVRKYYTEDSFTNTSIPILSNQIWDLDIRLYSDILIDNQAELNLTCNLELPPQSEILVKNNSHIKIDGGTINSSDNNSWNGIRIEDNSSLEVLPGTEINNNFFLAYTGGLFNKGNINNSNKTNDIEITDSKKEKVFSVYPNPFSSNLTVETSNFEGEEVKIQIQSILGKIVFKSNLNKSNQKINLSNLKEGIYIMLIDTNNKNFTKKLIKK